MVNRELLISGDGDFSGNKGDKEYFVGRSSNSGGDGRDLVAEAIDYSMVTRIHIARQRRSTRERRGDNGA